LEFFDNPILYNKPLRFAISFAFMVAIINRASCCSKSAIINIYPIIKSTNQLKLLKKNKKTTMSNNWAEHKFRLELDEIANEYRLEREQFALMSNNSNGLAELSKILSTGCKAAVIFLKEEILDEIGHVICIASRKSKLGGLDIAIFDANYGELLCQYNNSVSFEHKIINEINPEHDMSFERRIKTCENALIDLIEFYKNPNDEKANSETHKRYKYFKVFYLKI